MAPQKENVRKRSKAKSGSIRAGLLLPVGRIYKMLKRGFYAPRVGRAAAVSMTAVLEYLAAEIFELAAKTAEESNKLRISPRHILLAIRNDEELNRMLNGVIISSGGVIPNINKVLLPKKTKIDHRGPNTSSQEY